MQQLRNRPGGSAIADQLQDFVASVGIRQRCITEQGVAPPDDSFYHMVFTGNPGTGKTSTAVIIGELLRSLKFLEHGRVTTATAADLLGEFSNQVSGNTENFFINACGGVLLLDEAYQLGDAKEGRQVVASFLPQLETFRNKLVVIACGYKDSMDKKFFRLNEGLRSRFPYRFDMPDYTSDELITIFNLMVRNKKLTVDPEAHPDIARLIKRLHRKKSADWGNAREIENLVSTIGRKRARRVHAANLDLETPIVRADIPTLLEVNKNTEAAQPAV
jgi:replication-associated recombination protein RarA